MSCQIPPRQATEVTPPRWLGENWQLNMQQNQPFLNGLASEPAKSWKTILSIKQLPAGCLRRLRMGHAAGRSHWKRRPSHFEPAASLVVVGARILPPRSPSNRTRSRNGLKTGRLSPVAVLQRTSTVLPLKRPPLFIYLFFYFILSFFFFFFFWGGGGSKE